MSRITRWKSRLRHLLAPGSAERRMEEEFSLHVALETEKNVRAGMSPEEARRRARLTFGGEDAHREAMRDGRGARWLSDGAADVRYAVRTLGRNPGFAIVAVLTLALGIGANTAIFSLVDGILLRPLPFTQPDRLVALTDLSYKGELLALREQSRTMDVEAMGVGQEVSLTGSGEPARLEAAAVSSGAFGLTGVRAAHGRVIRAGDTDPGAEPVVVLSHGVWQQRFGGATSVIGERIRIDGVQRTVVGVLPPGTVFPSLRTQLWIPLELNAADAIGLWSISAGTLIARLRPGVTHEQAQAELSRLAPQMRDLFPWNMPPEYGATAEVVDLREFMVGDVRASLLVLLAAVGLVLLIACVNVANLLLARSSARGQESTVRAALGASRGRLIRQHLTESLVLGLGGAALGVLVARAGLPVLLRTLPPDTPRIDEIAIDLRVLAFAVVVTVGASLAFGLLPALKTAGVALHRGMTEGGRAAIGGRRRGRLAAALVVAEVALAVLLVTGSLLVLKGFWQLHGRDPGFATAGLATATLAPPDFRYPGVEQRRQFQAGLLDAVRRHGAVDGAALADRVPFGGRAYGSVFIIDGRPHPASTGGDWPWADVSAAVSDGFFELLGIRVLEGRSILPTDREGTTPVAVVSRDLAAEYWPDGPVIGQRISFPGDDAMHEIVGVVEDVHWERLTESGGTLYLPLRQRAPDGPLSAIIRADAAVPLAELVRSTVADLDDATPVADVLSLDALVDRSLQQPRVSVMLLALFSGLALVLGAIGIYGVVAFTVAQRTREFGVRLALGARPGTISRQIAREAGVLVATGVAAGVLGAAALTRFLAAQLYGVSAMDPVAFVLAPAMLAAAALLASWIPARRASRTDPAESLRAS